VIGTTAEHPFYAMGREWVSAGELRPGDRLASHDGQWAAVERVVATGRRETVYNLEVAEYHTYFVGGRDWGFSAWAHNADGYTVAFDGAKWIIKNAKGEIVNTARGLWDLGPGVRGELIEKMLGQNLPQTFDVFDKFLNGTATSIKSMDLAAQTYLQPQNIIRVGEKYVDAAAAFQGATRGGFTLRASQIVQRVVEIAVPSGTANAAQQTAFQTVINYGKRFGVIVNIVEV